MAKNELKILIGLHRAVNEFDRQTSRIASEYNLSLGQFAVLEALYHKGDMSVGQVQQKILSSSGTIPLIINNLEKRHYLERQIDPNDKRRCLLHLTQAGREVIEKAYPLNEKKIVELASCWSKSEQEQLVKLLKKFGERYETKN